MTRILGVVGLVGLGACAAVGFPAFAQTYPAQPIRVIVGFQAGGGVDISALPQIRAGEIKAIGVSILHRSSALPDVPTIDEAGLSGCDAATWYGLFAPAGTAKNILGTLGKEVVKIMSVPEIKERFANDGFEPVGSGPAEFSRFLRSELVKWAKAVTMAGIKPE